MDNVLYQREEFIIFKGCGGYIVYNTKKDFELGHTHLKSFKKSKSIIDLMFSHKVPHNESIRFLESIFRVSNDAKYKERIQEQIDIKRAKGKKMKYVNKILV